MSKTNADILTEIRAKLQPIIESYPDYSFLVVVGPDDPNIGETMLFGNSCLRCQMDFLVEYILTNRVEHLELDGFINDGETRH